LQQEGAGEDEVGALSSSLSSGLAYDEEWNQEQPFGTSFQPSAAPMPHSMDAPAAQQQRDRQALENLFKSLQAGNEAGHGGFNAPMDAPLPPTGLRSHVSAGPSYPTQQMDRLVLDNLFKSLQPGNHDAGMSNVRGAFDAPVPPPSGLRSHVSVGSSFQQPSSQSMNAFNFMYYNNQQQQQQQQPSMFSHSALNNMRQQEPFASSLSALQNQQTNLSQSFDLATFLRLQQLQQQKTNTQSNLEETGVLHSFNLAAATKTNDLDAELPTLPQEKVRSHQWVARVVFFIRLQQLTIILECLPLVSVAGQSIVALQLLFSSRTRSHSQWR
jgi:hypothetical protein